MIDDGRCGGGAYGLLWCRLFALWAFVCGCVCVVFHCCSVRLSCVVLYVVRACASRFGASVLLVVSRHFLFDYGAPNPSIFPEITNKNMSIINENRSNIT
jgi:hypothetical protein